MERSCRRRIASPSREEKSIPHASCTCRDAQATDAAVRKASGIVRITRWAAPLLPLARNAHVLDDPRMADFHSMRCPDESWDDHAGLAQLRREDPLHWEEDPGWWLVTRHADVKHVSRHPEIFSSEPRGAWHAFESRFSMQTDDSPVHHVTRNVVSRAFTPRSVARLEERALRYTDQAIDRVIANGSCDVVEDIAVPVPMRLIADLLGLESQIELFHAWTRALARAMNDDRKLAPGEEESVAREFERYVSSVVAERSVRPGEDLISEMLAHRAQGVFESFARDPFPGVPPGDGVLGFISFLVAAGSETTRHGIAQGIRALCRFSAERARLHADPRLWRSAVEEILRWTTPVRALRRTAVRDAELRGKRVRAGDSLVLLYLSANRDEEVFADPDVFRVDRRPNDHVSFGFGTHFCLGANLARMEMRVVIGRVLERLPDLELDGSAKPSFFRSAVMNGLTCLPVVFTPRAA
jgi:cholest-4-en-3-one 26-monooxygenase